MSRRICILGSGLLLAMYVVGRPRHSAERAKARGVPRTVCSYLVTDCSIDSWIPVSSHRRGRFGIHSDHLFLKTQVTMIVRHLPEVHSLVAVLEEREMQPIRAPQLRTVATRLAAPSSTGLRRCRRPWLETSPGHHGGHRQNPLGRPSDWSRPDPRRTLLPRCLTYSE